MVLAMGHGCAQNKGVINVLVGAPKSPHLVRGGLEAPHGLVGIFQIKAIGFTTVGEVVDAPELLRQAVEGPESGIGVFRWG